ncbi:hypothetical protein ACN4EG_27530 [Alkalinema pantanalense CENA528]|uniref:hypothetical protein n=1 Tax=Alkalinema pantanalense TaxID=1620705 RepID=UPI003D6E2066
MKEALENALSNASVLLSSGLNFFFGKDSSVGSGSPLPPSRKDVLGLIKKAHADGDNTKDDEAYAIVDILERISTKKDGRHFLSENKIAKFFTSLRKDPNTPPIDRDDIKLPEALIEKRNGTFVAVEVKNETGVTIDSALGKFKDIISLIRDPNIDMKQNISEYVLYLNPSKFRYFRDQLYSVGKGNILYYDGKPYKLPDGKTVQIKWSQFIPR